MLMDLKEMITEQNTLEDLDGILSTWGDISVGQLGEFLLDRRKLLALNAVYGKNGEFAYLFKFDNPQAVSASEIRRIPGNPQLVERLKRSFPPEFILNFRNDFRVNEEDAQETIIRDVLAHFQLYSLRLHPYR